MKCPGLLPRFAGQVVDYLLFCAVFFPVTYLVKGTWFMTRGDHPWVIFRTQKPTLYEGKKRPEPDS